MLSSGVSAVIMITATVSCWMMARSIPVRKASPIRSTASGFDGACCRWTSRLKQKSSIAAISNGALSAVSRSCQSPTGRNTARIAPKLSTASKKPPANENDGQMWTNRVRKSLLYQGFTVSKYGNLMVLYSHPPKNTF